jgi:two-component system response regulator YesN
VERAGFARLFGIRGEADCAGGGCERAAAELQSAVRMYLKGTVSVLVSAWGRFPEELTKLYEDALAAFRLRIGGEREMLLSVGEDRGAVAEITPLRSLYELPGLPQLLEAGQWHEAAEKLERVGDELNAIGPESEEHLLEAFLAIGAAFTSIAHKSGRRLSGLLGAAGYDRMVGGSFFRTAAQLKEWALELLGTLQADAESEVKDSRASLVGQVNLFIECHLAEDVSLQAIADHVHLHPVYVSKMYKLETGHNVSDYVYEVRMERAAHLLLESQVKIYEIAARLGYQRAHSFNHVFKKHYGLTPQEYRDKHQLQR